MNVGMYIGFYHLARPDLNPNDGGALQEADCFCETTNNYYNSNPYNRYLLPALDIEKEIEEEYGGEKLANWIHVWMKEVQVRLNLNEYPILYCSKTTAENLWNADNKIIDSDYSITDSPLWIVDWTKNELQDANYYFPDWNWSFRQYAGGSQVDAGRARCPGFAVDAGADLDIYNGDIEDLKSKFLIK